MFWFGKYQTFRTNSRAILSIKTAEVSKVDTAGQEEHPASSTGSGSIARWYLLITYPNGRGKSLFLWVFNPMLFASTIGPDTRHKAQRSGGLECKQPPRGGPAVAVGGYFFASGCACLNPTGWEGLRVCGNLTDSAPIAW